MTESEFAATPRGRAFQSLLDRPGVIARIAQASRAGRPAVEALDADVAQNIGPMTDSEKQAAGRVVKRALRSHGLAPARKGQRVRGAKVFARGTVYAPTMAGLKVNPRMHPEWTVEERFARAHELLMAGRIDPSKPLDTVDDFLADRRRMWGEE